MVSSIGAFAAEREPEDIGQMGQGASPALSKCCEP
jgi:hypothetical protein